MTDLPRLHVDQVLCKGHGLCFFGWPEFYDLNDDGIAVTLIDEVPADKLDAVRDSIAACPERAISLREE